MDIDLLAKMVKEVIMDHDSVTLPGVGSFVTEVVPASFADKGYTIHPPYRRLFFSPKQGDDTLLASLYASSNEISEEDATRILVEFLTEMKEVLKVRKTIVFPGLGRLRATRENHFFFVADEDLDIYPAGFGLEPVSLKTHEETKEEVAEAVSNLADMLEEPVADAPSEVPEADASPVAEENADAPSEAPASVVEPEPDSEELPELVTLVEAPEADATPMAEEIADAPSEVPEADASPVAEENADAPSEAPASVVEPEPEPAQKPESPLDYTLDPELDVPPPERDYRFLRIVLWVLVGIAALLVLAGIALAIVGRVAPEWVDKFLYSAEELQILHS